MNMEKASPPRGFFISKLKKAKVLAESSPFIINNRYSILIEVS